jgi:hypothetical protein
VIAFEERPEIVVDRHCDASYLTFLGVSLGVAATAVPGSRVVEVSFSPLVKGLVIEGHEPPQYTGFDGRPLRVENVRASVIYGSGVLHTDAEISFTVEDARVKRVSIYGRWLVAMKALNTMPKLFEAFGHPDVCLRLEADGDLLAYDSYYEASRKWVRWMADVCQPTVITYGADANVLRVDESCGVRRTDALGSSA